jgi:HAMP domain-containing protein
MSLTAGVARKTGVVAAIIVAAAVALEAGFRLTGPWIPLSPVGELRLDPLLGRIPAAGFTGDVRGPESSYHVAINSLGMRDREYGPTRPGEGRILLLGDSFVYGVGSDLEDSVSRQLEAMLAHTAGPSGASWIVMNGGVPGFNTVQELEWFRHLAPRLGPDLVLIGVHTGTDVLSNRASLAASRRGVPLPVKIPDWRDRVRERIHLAGFLHLRIYEAAARAGLREPYRADLDLAAALAKGSPGAREAIEQTADLLGQIALEAGRDGAAAAVFLIPVPAQVTPREHWYYARYYGVDMADDVLTTPHRLLDSMLEDRGIPCLDLLPLLRSATAGGPLYYRWNAHWTKRGNSMASAALARFLAERGLISRHAGNPAS